MNCTRLLHLVVPALTAALGVMPVGAQQTAKPPLHGRHWMAITGKPLAATAGAKTFEKGGNAVDAAAAMIAACATMLDSMAWGGETQALIYNPHTGKVIGVNALGFAPTGATAGYFADRHMRYPPEYGPLAALTPGTPGGIMTMVAEYGNLSLAQVLEPAIEMADGYAIEAQSSYGLERHKNDLKDWPDSARVFLPHRGERLEAPRPGEIFEQPELAATLRKLVSAEQEALAAGKNRKEAIYAAYDRFYRGDIAAEIVRSVRELGGLFTLDDLDTWQVHLEEPVKTAYKDVEFYKLTTWTQGPALLQTLNILEKFDLQEMGLNSARYIHTLYQAMNLAFADRDFYYGDPRFPPAEPIEGLLSKDYAAERATLISPEYNNPFIPPGDPYPFQGDSNPFLSQLRRWRPVTTITEPNTPADAKWLEGFLAGTTSVVAADAEGWTVAVTPSGGWTPAVIAGHTGIGLSQRMQSFVMNERENPFNVIEPRKQPRVTLTPTIALQAGKPFLAFAVQGGDTQEQNLLQFFLDVFEFGMTVQEAAEGPNITSYQMKSSFDDHSSQPGRIEVHAATPPWVINQLRAMGYRVSTREKTSGPINAIFFDRAHGTFWGGSSNDGEDYGIAW